MKIITVWSVDWSEGARVPQSTVAAMYADGEIELAAKPNPAYPPAKWKLHYRLTGKKYDTAGQSCRPGVWLMHGVAANQPGAKAVLAGWAFRAL